MTSETARSRRETVAQQTANRLRSDLAAGRWAEGAKLPSEIALAEELGVGRSSAREAIQSLARDGLLDVRHGTGIFVRARRIPDRAPLTVADMLRRARILEVYEVRRGLEVEAARLAAKRATPDALRAADGLLEERQRLVASDTAAFIDADLEFHRAVVAMSGNDLLVELFEQFYGPLRHALIALVDGEPGLPDTSADHAALLGALHAGDPDLAARATVDHCDVVIAMLRG